MENLEDSRKIVPTFIKFTSPSVAPTSFYTFFANCFIGFICNENSWKVYKIRIQSEIAFRFLLNKKIIQAYPFITERCELLLRLVGRNRFVTWASKIYLLCMFSNKAIKMDNNLWQLFIFYVRPAIPKPIKT